MKQSNDSKLLTKMKTENTRMQKDLPLQATTRSLYD